MSCCSFLVLWLVLVIQLLQFNKKNRFPTHNLTQLTLFKIYHIVNHPIQSVTKIEWETHLLDWQKKEIRVITQMHTNKTKFHKFERMWKNIEVLLKMAKW